MLVTFLVIVVSFDAKEGVAGVLEVLLNSFTSNSHSNFWSKIKDPPCIPRIGTQPREVGYAW